MLVPSRVFRQPTPAADDIAISYSNGNQSSEELPPVHRLRPLHDLADDIRYSIRTLSRAPGYAFSATLVLALGIGAAAAMFSAVDAVLLAQLPYTNDEQLVRIFEQNSPTNRWGLSTVDVQAIEQHSHTVSAVGAVRTREVGVSSANSVERHSFGYMNAGFMQALAAGVLLLNSLMQLQRVDPRFSTEHVQTMRVGVRAANYSKPGDAARFWQNAARNVSQIPGVVAAGFSSAIPPNDQGSNNDNYDLGDAPVAVESVCENVI